ncbi:hypothetical protein CYMTET_55022 [Cymbomonas tetramitiformis]|uniref:Uncharacterized protein n=1 Tax=Cymbomonas tetramitiformis TaxID=36881 RepID=A0AAE0BDS2_9CHLO|nr:hypothetical protein CYMTET_55022 [Cymbomonas tetramitiformis]
MAAWNKTGAAKMRPSNAHAVRGDGGRHHQSAYGDAGTLKEMWVTDEMRTPPAAHDRKSREEKEWEGRRSTRPYTTGQWRRGT